MWLHGRSCHERYNVQEEGRIRTRTVRRIRASNDCIVSDQALRVCPKRESGGDKNPEDADVLVTSQRVCQRESRGAYEEQEINTAENPNRRNFTHESKAALDQEYEKQEQTPPDLLVAKLDT